MEIRILGPIEVVSQGASVPLGGPKQRALLAALVLRRGEAISAERLVDLLWGESPPATADKTVHVFVSRLRKVLGDGVIVTGRAGYRLEIDPEAIDAERFERLLAQARVLRDSGAAKEAAGLLRTALVLWRGSPLADLVYERFIQADVARLDELRLVALEERIDLDLRLDGTDKLVPELEGLVLEHPLRERLQGQLMLALYRTGRQADALALYRRTRQTLAEDLGLGPGPELRALEQAILRQDPALGAVDRRPQAVARARRRGALLLAFAGVAIIVSAALAAATLLGGGAVSASLRTSAPDSLAVIDPERNAVVADLAVGSGPTAVTVGAGSVWVATAGDQTLARVDPAARQVIDRIGVSHIPTQLAFGQGALWAASSIGERGVVSRVDPGVRAVVATDTVRVGAGSRDDLFAPPTPSTIAVGPTGVFTNDLHSRVWWLTNGNRGARTFDLGASHSVDGLALGHDAVWVTSGVDDRVLRLDPRNGHVVAEIPIAAMPHTRLASPYAILVGDGSVWVTDTLANAVSRIDPRLNAVTSTIKVGRRPTRLAVGEGGVWVLNAGDGTVSRIDPKRNAVSATIPVGPDVTGIAAGLGGVWVTLGGGPPRASRPSRSPPVTPLSSPNCSRAVRGSGADVLVASDLPTSLGGPTVEPVIADMRAAIHLVLRQHSFRAGRYRVVYQACDDSRPAEGADPGLCAANARAYALDPSLIGVIGSFASSCSGVELPTLNAAATGPVAMISPTNTYVGLTHAGPATAADEPDRYDPTGARSFVRLIAADDYQSAGIDLFLKQTGHTRLYLLNDGEGTGYAGAAYAQRAAGNIGIEIAGSGIWNPAARNYRQLAQQIARTGADAILLSGCICSNGLRLITDLRSVLHDKVTMIGTDNFASSAGFLHSRGGFDGLYISTAGLPTEALPQAAKSFLKTLFPRRQLDNIDPAVVYAAQATELMLDAIANSDGTRASVTRELLATTAKDTIAGAMSFDARGDPARTPIAIYRVSSTSPSRPNRSEQGMVLNRIVEPRPHDIQ